jgi:hypothetical protein
MEKKAPGAMPGAFVIKGVCINNITKTRRVSKG